jgi:predicted DNA-binding transcriptional regulator AlpA
MAAHDLALPRPRAADRARWLSIEDFCAELGVSRSTAYKWSCAGSASGKFPRCRKLPNGSIRIRRDWFEEWLDGLDPAS